MTALRISGAKKILIAAGRPAASPSHMVRPYSSLLFFLVVPRTPLKTSYPFLHPLNFALVCTGFHITRAREHVVAIVIAIIVSI